MAGTVSFRKRAAHDGSTPRRSIRQRGGRCLRRCVRDAGLLSSPPLPSRCLLVAAVVLPWRAVLAGGEAMKRRFQIVFAIALLGCLIASGRNAFVSTAGAATATPRAAAKD